MVTEVKNYICDVCGHLHVDKKVAEKCESAHLYPYVERCFFQRCGDYYPSSIDCKFNHTDGEKIITYIKKG